MQLLNKNKKIKVKKKKFKKLTLFQLQNRAEGQIWGSWVNKRGI